MIRCRKASGEPVPVALLLSSRTYKSRSSFLRAFCQVHGYVPAESEGNGQNSDAAAEKAAAIRSRVN